MISCFTSLQFRQLFHELFLFCPLAISSTCLFINLLFDVFDCRFIDLPFVNLPFHQLAIFSTDFFQPRKEFT
jgi:hypothetical protein